MLASHTLSARHVDHGGDGAGEVDDAGEKYVQEGKNKAPVTMRTMLMLLMLLMLLILLMLLMLLLLLLLLLRY